MEDKHDKKRWNAGSVFWGLLLILIGLLFLLDNLAIVDVNFSNTWRLWPLLVIAAGLSVLPIRGWVGAAITSVAVLAMLGLVALVALNIINPDTTSRTEEKNIEIGQSSKVNALTVNVKTGAGEIAIGSSPEVTAVATRLESSFARLDQKSTNKDDIQEIDISTIGNKNWWGSGSFKNNLSLTLTQSLPLSFAINTGASHVAADLSGAQLRKLTINSGASDLEFKLGNRTDTTDVNFDVGASSITFKVPENSGVSVRLDGSLNGKELPGFDVVSDNYYETANYRHAQKKINVRGDMGMANLTIEKY